MAGAGRMTPIGGEMFLAVIGRLPDDPWQSLLVFATGCDRKTSARPGCGVKMKRVADKAGRPGDSLLPWQYMASSTIDNSTFSQSLLLACVPPETR